jgi:hypothetical protein
MAIKLLSRFRDFLHLIGDWIPDRDIRSLAGNAGATSHSQTVSATRTTAQTMEPTGGVRRGAKIIALVEFNQPDRQSGMPGAIARPGSASI